MSTGEIIYAVMVGMQGLTVLVGITLVIVGLVKEGKNFYSDRGINLVTIGLILFAISNVFPIVGVICCNVL